MVQNLLQTLLLTCRVALACLSPAWTWEQCCRGPRPAGTRLPNRNT